MNEKGITTYTIRRKALIPQSTLTKFKMCSGAAMEESEKKLHEYKDTRRCLMTSIRQEAIQMLEKVPEDKLSFVIQIMQGVNGLLGTSDVKEKEAVNLNQFVMESTERGQNADKYVRELRDNDRF